MSDEFEGMNLEFESEFSDSELGMDRGITRRDVLDGFAVGAAGAAVLGTLGGSIGGKAIAATRGDGKGKRGKRASSAAGQPPERMGMRGTSNEVTEVMDRLIAGRLDTSGARKTDEEYDLVIVGAGISGLSAAYFYRRDVDPNAKILLIDPHDDFGGHAKRNEFLISSPNDPTTKHRRISTAGSSSADHVNAGVAGGDWSTYGMGEAKVMLDELGMSYTGQGGSTPSDPFPSGGPSRTLWLKEVWNAAEDVLQLGLNATDQINQSPMDPLAKQQRLALNTAGNWLAHLAPAERVELLKQHTVGSLVSDLGPVHIAGFGGQPVHKDVFKHLATTGGGGSGYGFAQMPALDAAIAQSLPGVGSALTQGFDTIPGENFPAEPIRGAAMTNVLRWNSGPGTVSWLGGNSMVARRLVANLIPKALEASTDQEFVTAYTDYSQLDRNRNDVRIRLSSTVVNAQHGKGGKSNSKHVRVTYVDNRTGKMYSVKGRHLFFGCWNAAIPFIAPELPQIRKQALADAVKIPMESTRVGLTNYQAWMQAGVSSVSLPGAYYTSMGISRGGIFGDPATPYYRGSQGPDKPIMMNLSRPHVTGLNADGTFARWSAQEASARAQAELVNQSFKSMERRIRDYLVRGLDGTDFDPARDIGAVAVNRWQQGYMRWYHLPNDAAFWKDFGTDLLPEGDTPNKTGSAPWGRMTVGTTDAVGHGFFESSIMAAYGAVQYLSAID